MCLMSHLISGYMDKELFRDWFLNLFLKHCGTQRPILLVMDNHDSHFSLEVLEKAMEERVNSKPSIQMYFIFLMHCPVTLLVN